MKQAICPVELIISGYLLCQEIRGKPLASNVLLSIIQQGMDVIARPACWPFTSPTSILAGTVKFNLKSVCIITGKDRET